MSEKTKYTVSGEFPSDSRDPRWQMLGRLYDEKRHHTGPSWMQLGEVHRKTVWSVCAVIVANAAAESTP